METDSFRGSCLKCGGPIREGNIHLECAHTDRTPPKEEWRMRAPTPQISASPTVQNTARKVNGVMANVQVCERCGSIGQARDFISVSAVTMTGSPLHMPELITSSQLEKLQEDDDVELTTSFTMCRNCKSTFTSFMHNIPTESGKAGPLAPRLPSGETHGTQTH